MNDGWDTGMETFAGIDAFYGAQNERRSSGEMDFGCWWWDGPQGHSDQWRVSAVEATGEIYAIRERSLRQQGRGTDHPSKVNLLGGLGHDPGYAKSSACLDGWEQVCGAADSLQWVVDRVRLATGMISAVEAPTVPSGTSTLGEVAAAATLLLTQLQPWSLMSEERRAACVRLTLVLSRLPERDPAEEAFERGYLEALAAYAYSSSEAWAENGVQYVGSTGTTLARARERFLEERRGVADLGDPS